MNRKKHIFKTILGLIVLIASGCATDPASMSKLRDSDYDAVVEYVSQGHDVNEPLKDYEGRKVTLLAKAVKGNSLKLTKYLASKGVTDINEEYEGEYRSYTLLTGAVYGGNPELVSYLISIGADVNKKLDGAWGAIVLAAHGAFLDNTGHLIVDDKVSENIGVEMVDILMKAGADINNTDALHKAADSNRDKIIEHLFKNFNIDPNVRDVFNETPLHKAAEFTPYTLAAGHDNHSASMNSERVRDASNTINLLIKYGADPFIKNDDGKTAQDVFNKSVELSNNANREFAENTESGFQWGKFAAMSVGAAIGGAGSLSSDQQLSLTTAMVQDSAANADGVSNTRNYTNSQIEKFNTRDSKSGLNTQANKNTPMAAKSGGSCSADAGSYLESGRWKTHYSLGADCTGSYCVQVLNNPEIPTSGYGWYCNEGRGNKQITGWKKSNGNYLISFADGQFISRPVTYLKKQN